MPSAVEILAQYEQAVEDEMAAVARQRSLAEDLCDAASELGACMLGGPLKDGSAVRFLVGNKFVVIDRTGGQLGISVTELAQLNGHLPAEPATERTAKRSRRKLEGMT